MKYVIGIDLGTSATKTVLFDEKGGEIASATVEYPLYQPHNGWAEQNPSDWYSAAVETISAVLKKSGVGKEEIVSLGISGQMHGLVMLDANCEVIRPAILWCDQRTGKECEQLTEMLGKEKLIEITANPALTGFTASKILWVKNNEPENFEKCEHILLPKDYLRFKLTGDFATEVSDASGMQLLDVPKRCWSEEVINVMGVPASWLPKVYESPEVTGHISEAAAEVTGLSVNTLVVGGAGDNAAAAVGMGVVKAGSAFTTVGTSGVVYAHTDGPVIDPKGRVHTFCCAVPNCWHMMGVTQGAGLSMQWFKNQFCASEISEAEKTGEDVYKITDGEAAKIGVGSDGLLYLPYLMGERTPHLDPDCRGVFFGISAMHTRAHFIRAVMEGVAFSLKDCLGILHGMDIVPDGMLLCGGGAKSPLWRKIICSAFELPIKQIKAAEGPALGVAILAAVGAGIYPTVEEACAVMTGEATLSETPDAAECEAYNKYYKIYGKLYSDLKDTFAELRRI